MKYAQQFLGSLYRNLTGLHGSIGMVQQVKATLVTQGITLTAAQFGTVGNSVTFTVTGGATAGSETVSVSGNAISVRVESGVSTITQVATKLQASTAAVALAVTTSTGTAAVSTATVLPLAGGIDGVVSQNIIGVDSVVQSGVGELTLTLSRAWPSHLWTKCQILKAVPQDLIPQVISSNLLTTKITKINLLTGATPTDPTAAMTLYVGIWFRDSSVTK